MRTFLFCFVYFCFVLGTVLFYKATTGLVFATFQADLEFKVVLLPQFPQGASIAGMIIYLRV